MVLPRVFRNALGKSKWSCEMSQRRVTVYDRLLLAERSGSLPRGYYDKLYDVLFPK